MDLTEHVFILKNLKGTKKPAIFSKQPAFSLFSYYSAFSGDVLRNTKL